MGSGGAGRGFFDLGRRSCSPWLKCGVSEVNSATSCRSLPLAGQCTVAVSGSSPAFRFVETDRRLELSDREVESVFPAEFLTFHSAAAAP